MRRHEVPIASPGYRPWLAAAVGLVFGLAPARAVAEIKTDNPVKGPPSPQAVGMPALPATGGFIFQPPVSFTGSSSVHEGSYSWAPDLAAAPLQTPQAGATCQELVSQTLPQPLFMAATAALVSRLGDPGEALDASTQTVDQLDAGGLGDFAGAVDIFLDALAHLPGASVPNVNVGDTQRRCFAYPAVHARWLASQWAKASPAQAFETHFTYNTSPRPFREIRERGARLYCASRAAQMAQGDQVFSMGARPGFTVNVLGEKVDFFVTEASVVFDGPERFTGLGANDGAQAFEVPLLLGTRITPIRGLNLPGFREVRVPISLVTAESEVRTDANFRSILIASSPPTVIQDYGKTYHTVTHLDTIQSATKTASLGVLDPAKILLFRVGPLAVELGFHVSYDVGNMSAGNDRVLAFPGFPTARRGRLWQQTTGTGRRVHDGAWAPELILPGINQGNFPLGLYWAALRPNGLPESPFWIEPIDLLLPPPLDIRLLHDDDHAITSATTLAIGGSLAGVLGGSFGPFDVSLIVTGDLTGTVTQKFLLRDSLLAQDQGGSRMTPITGLGVRQRQEGSAKLTPAKGEIHLVLDLPGPFLDDIDIKKKLFSVDPITLAAYNSDDDLPLTGANDDSNLRLGTGASKGDVMKKPVVMSHFPGAGAEFQSFVTGVDECLADPAENPSTPALCDPVQPTGGTPQKELCVLGPSNLLEGVLGKALPPNVCANVPGFVASLALPSEKQECIESFLGFLCSPVSKQQAKPGNFSQVVSHVLNLLDGAQLAAFEQMLHVCVAAFGSQTSDGVSGASGVAEQFLEFAVCDADGTIRDGEGILGVVNPSAAPPVEPAPPCH